LQAEHRKLLVEVATLRSPRRLRRLAVEQLGMVEPTTARVLRSDGCDRGELALRPER
jgi:cell division protein FtsL